MTSVDEFERVIDAIYGVYLDSTTGFSELKKLIQSQQRNTLQWLKESRPELATEEYLDGTLFIYGKGDPNKPESIQLHRCTQGQYKSRNSENGLNYLFIGNMVVVSIYQYWEDYYRNEIAKYLGCEKTDLIEPIMGDLRLLRHSIIHHGGVALNDVEKCEVLKWYTKGQNIFIDKTQCEEVITQVKEMISRYRKANTNA